MKPVERNASEYERSDFAQADGAIEETFDHARMKTVPSKWSA